MKLTSVAELKSRLVELSHLSSALHLLHWDQSVYLPPKAGDVRATAISSLSGLVHKKFIDINADGLLTKLKKQLDAKKITGDDAVVVTETWRSFERSIKLPDAFVRELAETTALAHGVWVQARKTNNFKLFLPWLEKIVKLKQKEAKLVGYKDSPYDALIDEYEPGITTVEAAKILNDLKDFLVPFIKQIKNSKKGKGAFDSKKLKGKFPIAEQEEFNKFIIGKMGFDFEAGRLDTLDPTNHPFESGLHPLDVRLTTRYAKDNVLYAIGTTVHEAGHGIYDQGLMVEHFGTPLAEAISHGIHESQSRLWENNIGKSLPFWKYFYPKLQKKFPKPFAKVPLLEFYKIYNKVEPSLIRTESDEVTYNLHIIVRFEIEKEMIEGSIDLADLPKIWRAKMKEYLGVDVPTDSLGVLQDVHWSGGGIGYFPTYSFGNLYAAQFYAAMKKAIPDIDKQIAKGELHQIRSWLNKHIHAHGKTYTAAALVKKVTGEDLNSRYFADYLTEKYSKIYLV